MLKSVQKNSIRGYLKNTAGNLSLAISRFGKDTRGNFAVMFGVAAVPILGFTGLAVEFTRYSMVNEGLTNSLDSAGLAISQRAEAMGWDIGSLTDPQKEQLKEYGIDFFNANFSANDDIKELAVDFVFTSTTVTPQASGYMETSLMGLLGVDKFNMNNSTEITLQGAGRLELALVLDVTGSMDSNASGGGGDSRMDVLKEAVNDMMDTLYGTPAEAENDNVKVGIVPFNTIVNTGGTAQMQDAWLDLDAESMYHGNAFFHVEDPFDIDETDKVNLFHLYDSIGSETSWKGCVESRPFPLDEMDTEPGSSVSASNINAYNDIPSGVDTSVYTDVADAFSNAPSLPYSASAVGAAVNSRFVPFFYPDQPDCSVVDGKDACNYGSGAPGYLYDDIDEDGDYQSDYENRNFIRDWQYTHMSQGNVSAREAYNEVVCQQRFNIDGRTSGGCHIYPLVSDSAWTSIIAKTQATNAGSDEYRLRQAYPGIYNPATEKYEGKYDLTVSVSEGSEKAGQGPNRDCSTPILPLTTKKADVTSTITALDPGGATNTAVGAIWGWRVLSNEAPFTEGVDTSVDTDWRKAVVLMTDGQNNVGGRSGAHNRSDFEAYGFLYENRLNSDADEGDYEDELDRKTIRICHGMQAAGIKVYTVGFGISSGSGADKMLKACASEPDGDDKTYYLAANANQLKAAFQEITEDLVNLHISG